MSSSTADSTSLGQLPQTWFGASLCVPAAARERVDEEIREYVTTIREYFAQNRVGDANLYLGGSLARGEPSVRPGPDGPRLASDLDLIVVTPEDLPAAHPARGLDDHLRSRHPGLQVLTLFVRAGDLPRAASLHGLDLWHGLRCPLVCSFEVHRPAAPPRVGLRQRLEVLAHQAGLALMTPAETSTWYLFRTERAVHRLKLRLESLRCLLPQRGGEPLCYADIVRCGGAGLDRVADAAERARLVRARELGERPMLAGGEVGMSLAALKALLQIETDAEMVQALRELAVRSPHRMNTFQFGVLLLAVATGTRDRAAVSTVPPAFGEVCRSSGHTTLPGGEGAALRESLALVRGEYYESLKHHNNGRSVLPGYAEFQ